MQVWIFLLEGSGTVMRKYSLTYPTSQPYSREGMIISHIYQQHEKDKKDQYNKELLISRNFSMSLFSQQMVR